MFVSTGQLMASGPQCYSTGWSDLDKIRSNTLKDSGGKEHRTSFFLSFFFFFCKETAVDIMSTFYVLAQRRNFCICACHSVFFWTQHVCTVYWRIGPLEATCQTRVTELEMAPGKQRAMLDTGKQKWNTFPQHTEREREVVCVGPTVYRWSLLQCVM